MRYVLLCLLLLTMPVVAGEKDNLKCEVVFSNQVTYYDPNLANQQDQYGQRYARVIGTFKLENPTRKRVTKVRLRLYFISPKDEPMETQDKEFRELWASRKESGEFNWQSQAVYGDMPKYKVIGKLSWTDERGKEHEIDVQGVEQEPKDENNPVKY